MAAAVGALRLGLYGLNLMFVALHICFEQGNIVYRASYLSIPGLVDTIA